MASMEGGSSRGGWRESVVRRVAQASHLRAASLKCPPHSGPCVTGRTDRGKAEVKGVKFDLASGIMFSA